MLACRKARNKGQMSNDHPFIDMENLRNNARGTFLFDYDKLMAYAEANCEAYKSNQPFPHIVIDDFICEELVDNLLAGIPEPDPARQTRNNSAWANKQDTIPAQTGKVGLREERDFSPLVRHLLWEMNSPSFISFVEKLTGIANLLPDPKMLGAGTHQTLPGGLLRVHADFNIHRIYMLDRRLNIILYMNKDWKEEYGGHLELWDKEVTTCVNRVLPIAGRCVIFSTGSDTWHGHPQPLTCPEGRCRQSIALYYYTNGRPEHERRPRHKTLWPPLPGEEAVYKDEDQKYIIEGE